MWAEECDQQLRQDGTIDPRQLYLEGPPIHSFPDRTCVPSMGDLFDPSIAQMDFHEISQLLQNIQSIDNVKGRVGVDTALAFPHLTCRTGDVDPFGNAVTPAVPVDSVQRMTWPEAYAYLEYCSQNRGYWFVVYRDPPRHADLMARMRDPSSTAKNLDEYRGEISFEILGKVASQMRGLEILQEHEPSTTLGVVSEAFQDPRSGTLYALVRPFNSWSGKVLCAMVELGVRECSLRHAMCDRGNRQCIQIQELSVCQKGRREGTTLQCIVDMSAKPRPPYYPRQFQAPVFLFSKGSATTTTTVFTERGSRRCMDVTIPAEYEVPARSSGTHHVFFSYHTLLACTAVY